MVVGSVVWSLMVGCGHWWCGYWWHSGATGVVVCSLVLWCDCWWYVWWLFGGVVVLCDVVIG